MDIFFHVSIMSECIEILTMVCMLEWRSKELPKIRLMKTLVWITQLSPEPACSRFQQFVAPVRWLGGGREKAMPAAEDRFFGYPGRKDLFCNGNLATWRPLKCLWANRSTQTIRTRLLEIYL